mmetsp:Transcript_81529/g.253384  ORF Transcript_81529/g.253384 Transcript_81529/m.253384 type:complete len:284 (-) Transcript_81529:30-881(-)
MASMCWRRRRSRSSIAPVSAGAASSAAGFEGGAEWRMAHWPSSCRWSDRTCHCKDFFSSANSASLIVTSISKETSARSTPQRSPSHRPVVAIPSSLVSGGKALEGQASSGCASNSRIRATSSVSDSSSALERKLAFRTRTSSCSRWVSSSASAALVLGPNTSLHEAAAALLLAPLGPRLATPHPAIPASKPLSGAAGGAGASAAFSCTSSPPRLRSDAEPAPRCREAAMTSWDRARRSSPRSSQFSRRSLLISAPTASTCWRKSASCAIATLAGSNAPGTDLV